MLQYLQSLIDSNFATGVLHYEDAYPGQEDLARIVITAFIEPGFPTQFVVDTGAPWCILDPELAPFVSTAATASYAPQERICIRGVTYEGCLHRMNLRLVAEYGSSVEIDATVFVPSLFPGQSWPHPNFIGLDGFLDRIRFALDPAENAFYFGVD